MVVEPAQDKSRTFRVTFCTIQAPIERLYLPNIAGLELLFGVFVARKKSSACVRAENSDEEEL